MTGVSIINGGGIMGSVKSAAILNRRDDVIRHDGAAAANKRGGISNAASYIARGGIIKQRLIISREISA